MDDEISRVADSLEEQINVGYSKVALDHAMKPRNVGRAERENGFASYTGPCGDTMMISLRVEGGRIAESRFWTDGCGATIASGSMVTELAEGKTLEEAVDIGQADVLAALGGLPAESEHCALLAATALRKAVEDYLERTKDRMGPEEPRWD